MTEVWITRRDKSVKVATCSYHRAYQHLVNVLRTNPRPTTITLVTLLNGRGVVVDCRTVD